MNALQVAQNPGFLAIAMADAFELISSSTGISVQSLQEQWPTNIELQTRVGEMVALAAKVVADELNK